MFIRLGLLTGLFVSLICPISCDDTNTTQISQDLPGFSCSVFREFQMLRSGDQVDTSSSCSSSSNDTHISMDCSGQCSYRDTRAIVTISYWPRTCNSGMRDVTMFAITSEAQCGNDQKACERKDRLYRVNSAETLADAENGDNGPLYNLPVIEKILLKICERKPCEIRCSGTLTSEICEGTNAGQSDQALNRPVISAQDIVSLGLVNMSLPATCDSLTRPANANATTPTGAAQGVRVSRLGFLIMIVLWTIQQVV